MSRRRGFLQRTPCRARLSRRLGGQFRAERLKGYHATRGQLTASCAEISLQAPLWRCVLADLNKARSIFWFLFVGRLTAEIRPSAAQLLLYPFPER